MSSTLVCPSCRETVEPCPPRRNRAIFETLFWLFALGTATAAVAFFGLIGLAVLLLPLWLVVGMGVGAAARRASSWYCPVCRYELPPPREVLEAKLAKPFRPAVRRGA
jgi:hypothetical protein